MSSNYPTYSDLELAAAYKQQPDNDIIAEFYTRYKRVIFKKAVYWNYKYCQSRLNAEIIEDFVTEVFTKIIYQLTKYNIDSNFKSWLFTLAHSLFIDTIRKEALTLAYFDLNNENILNLEVESEEPDSLLSRKWPENEQQQSIQDIFSTLDHYQIDATDFIIKCIETLSNQEQKICLYHFYINHLTYKSIVKETGFEEKKVKTNLQHGKKQLQRSIIQALSQLNK